MSSALGSSGRLFFTERGAGPPLLLVHGLMVTGDMFAPVVDRFATTHRVIIPDLRGHSRSRALPPPYTARQLATDLTWVLQQLGIDLPDLADDVEARLDAPCAGDLRGTAVE